MPERRGLVHAPRLVGIPRRGRGAGPLGPRIPPSSALRPRRAAWLPLPTSLGRESPAALRRRCRVEPRKSKEAHARPGAAGSEPLGAGRGRCPQAAGAEHTASPRSARDLRSKLQLAGTQSPARPRPSRGCLCGGASCHPRLQTTRPHPRVHRSPHQPWAAAGWYGDLQLQGGRTRLELSPRERSAVTQPLCGPVVFFSRASFPFPSNP